MVRSRSAEQRRADSAGWPVHHLGVDLFGLEHDRTGGVDDELKEGDLHGEQDERPAGDEHGDERHPEDGDVDGEDVGHRLVEVVEDPAPLADAAGDRAEVVVGDDQVGGLSGDVGAASAHGDADVGGAQGGGVVDAVAGHADDLTVGVEGADELKLLFGHHAGEHVDGSGSAGEFVVAHRGELRSGDGAGGGVDADVAGDREGGARDSRR